jgi:hypothetical protein
MSKGYRGLIREAREQRAKVAVKSRDAARLGSRLMHRLRTPRVILPAFLGGYALGHLVPWIPSLLAMAITGRRSTQMLNQALGHFKQWQKLEEKAVKIG